MGQWALSVPRPGDARMSLETFARQYWFASSFLKGRDIPRPMSRMSAETCVRDLAFGCRWGSLRRAAQGSVRKWRLAAQSNDVEPRGEWYWPCDTEPERETGP